MVKLIAHSKVCLRPHTGERRTQQSALAWGAEETARSQQAGRRIRLMREHAAIVSSGRLARTSQNLRASAALVRAGLPACLIAASRTVRTCSVCKACTLRTSASQWLHSYKAAQTWFSCHVRFHIIDHTSVAPRDVPAKAAD